MVGLSILSYPDDDILDWAYQILNSKNTTTTAGLIENSPCITVNAADGRFSVNQVKVCFAYQAIAYCKFGRKELGNVPASKNATDLLISHLCGTHNCCEKNHIILEQKKINDERTHCHECAKSVYNKNKGEYANLKVFFDIGGCKHRHDDSNVIGCCIAQKTVWVCEPKAKKINKNTSFLNEGVSFFLSFFGRKPEMKTGYT